MVAIRLKTRRQRRHRRAISAARAQLDQARSDIRDLGRLGQPVIARERETVLSALMDNRRQLAHGAIKGSVPALAPLELDSWVLWRPDATVPVTEVRVGMLREGAEGEPLGVPCVVPIVAGRAIVIVSHGARQSDAARGLWQAVITRLAAMSARRSAFVLVDPVGGAADHRLFTHVIGGGDVAAELDRLVAAPSSSERVIAVANVPTGLGVREAALLLAMVRSGLPGTTLVVHVDLDLYRSTIAEPDLGEDTARWLIDLGVTEVGDAGPGWTVQWDAAPPKPLVDLIAERLPPND